MGVSFLGSTVGRLFSIVPFVCWKTSSCLPTPTDAAFATTSANPRTWKLSYKIGHLRVQVFPKTYGTAARKKLVY
jgi:hypothetical protein